MTVFETELQGQEALSFFSRIWKNVNPKNSTMVQDTSLDYLYELGEEHRNIIYSLSCANMLGKYISHLKIIPTK